MKFKSKMQLAVMLITAMALAADVKAQESFMPGALTIKQSLDIALTNNNALRADSLNIGITDYKNKQLKGAYLPQVNYSSKLNYNIAIPSQMLPGKVAGQPEKDYVPIQFGTKYEAGSSLEVTQTIYRKDLLLQMRATGLNTAIAQTKYNLSKEELVYQVAAAYYALQSSAEMIRSTESDYKNMKDVLAISKAQFDNGLIKRIDYESLQINVANLQSQLSQLKTQYNEQLSYFKYLLGVAPETTIIISDTIASVQDFSSNDNNKWTEREDLHLYHQLMQSKEVEMKSIKAEGKPAISSYFRFNYQSQFSDASKITNNDYWFKSSSVGLTMSVPLFDGNRRKNRVNAASTELQQLQWQTEQQKQKAQTEVITAWETFNNNRDQYQINQQNLTLSEKVFASRRALYTEGVTTLAELLDAERDLTQSRNLYIQSMIDVQTGMLDVHKATGTLLTEFMNAL